MPSCHSSPSVSLLSHPHPLHHHLQEHPERIQLGGRHHPPEAHPIVVDRSLALTFCSSTQGREFPRSILPLWPSPF